MTTDQLITFAAAIIAGLGASILNPWFHDRWLRTGIKRQRKIEAITEIYAWVKEHLMAATLPFYKASEEDKEWRSAVYRYEESDASFSHTLALTRRLGNVKQVEAQLGLLRNETNIMMKTYAWNKLHRQEKDDPKSEAEFESVKDKAINYASEIYRLLDTEASEFLGV